MKLRVTEWVKQQKSKEKLITSHNKIKSYSRGQKFSNFASGLRDNLAIHRTAKAWSDLNGLFGRELSSSLQVEI